MVYLGATVDASGILAPIIGCCLIHEKYPTLMINPCLYGRSVFFSVGPTLRWLQRILPRREIKEKAAAW